MSCRKDGALGQRNASLSRGPHSVGADRAALAQLLVTHRPRLHRIAMAVVQHPQAAEDVLQDAYLKLAAARSAEQVEEPLAYCGQVVRNLARDHVRRTALEAVLLAEEAEGWGAEAQDGQPERQAMWRQDLTILSRALATVPARTRVAYEMHIVRGMTQRDIGQALALSVGSVNALIKEAGAVLTRHRHLLAWR